MGHQEDTTTDSPDKSVLADLTSARLYLESVASMCAEAARSPDPRVIWCALALLRLQIERSLL
jgi:hypothetical protein